MAEIKFPEFGSKHVIRQVKKGEMLLRQGDPSDSFFYVISGCLRSYIIDQKGKEHIVQFAPEDWIISDHEKIIINKPALLNIDAIEDSMVKIMKKPGDFKLMDLEKEVLVEMNLKFEKRIVMLQKRIISLISATAEERYDEFNMTYPNLAKRLPQKMIASYLGITPEGLSRVRKERVSRK